MAFNKTTLRTDIITFLKEMTNNGYFLPVSGGAVSFKWYEHNVRPKKEDCKGRNLIYAYCDGRTNSITANNTNQISQNVVIGILRPDIQIMGVTQISFDNTWSALQTNFASDKMRVRWDNISAVMGFDAPFTYGDLGILDIRSYGGDKPTEIGNCGALRYEMLLEIKFNFNQNL